MKINTKIILKDLENGNIKDPLNGKNDLTLGMVIARILTGNPKEIKQLSPLKAFDLAMKFNNNNIVEIDKADYKEIKEIIKKSSTYAVLVIGQIEKELDNQELIKVEKDKKITNNKDEKK